MRRTKTVVALSALTGGLAAALAVLFVGPSGGTSRSHVIVPAGGTAFASEVTGSSPLTARQVYERDAHGVVAVRASGRSTASGAQGSPSPGGAESAASDTGSGIVVSATGLIVTNDHVVDGARTITVALDGEAGRERRATLVSADRADDLALLRIDPTGVTLHALTLGDSGTAQIGDGVYAIGNPFGLNWTLTTGIVSALNREISSPSGSAITHVIQTDAALNPGNSGGPLIDVSGEVIGINSQIISGSSTAGSQGGSSGVGFAVPSDTVRHFLQGAASLA